MKTSLVFFSYILSTATALVLDDPAAFESFVESKKADWEANGPADYTFGFERPCGGCVEDYRGPFSVTVRSGAVSSVEFTARDLLNKTVSSELVAGIPNMEGLFEIIQHALHHKHLPAGLEADFNSKYGFPERISIDFVKDIEEDDKTYRVTNFLDESPLGAKEGE